MIINEDGEVTIDVGTGMVSIHAGAIHAAGMLVFEELAEAVEPGTILTPDVETVGDRVTVIFRTRESLSRTLNMLQELYDNYDKWTS